MNNLPHLATRVFDNPLLIAPQKLEVILGVLSARFGLVTAVPAAVLSDRPNPQKLSEVTADGIAIIPVEGTLVHKSYGLDAHSGLRSYLDVQDEVEEAATDPAVRGILLDIDSPGGEVAGAFDLADVIYSARTTKPIVAVANSDAFSAAYLLASAAEQLYAGRTSGLGSVGVIITHLDLSASDAKLGYKYTIVHAGARKADFNPHAPLTTDARLVLEAEVDRTYGLLVDTVARNRGLPASTIRQTEAALYFGQEAIAARLADRVGTIQDALNDLRERIDRSRARAIHSREKSKMQEEQIAAAVGPPPDFESDQQQAHQRGYADAREIVELCALAGMPGRAPALLARQATPAEARQALIEARAAEDNREIDSHVMPDSGTSATSNPENNPVLKAVERLAVAGKGGN